MVGVGWVGGWSGRVGGVVSGCGVLWRVVGCAGDAGAGGQRCEGEWVLGEWTGQWVDVWMGGWASDGWVYGWLAEWARLLCDSEVFVRLAE